MLEKEVAHRGLWKYNDARMCVPPSLRSTGKKYVKQKMRKRILSFALALILCLSLLPATALAAEEPLPDWYFLFAVFKNVDADYMQNDIKKTHKVFHDTG